MDIIDIIIFALMGISGVANIALGYLTNRFGKKSVAIHANATFKETFFNLSQYSNAPMHTLFTFFPHITFSRFEHL